MFKIFVPEPINKSSEYLNLIINGINANKNCIICNNEDKSDIILFPCECYFEKFKIKYPDKTILLDLRDDLECILDIKCLLYFKRNVVHKKNDGSKQEL